MEMWLLAICWLATITTGLAAAMCPISISYEVSLGQQSRAGGDASYSGVPIFFARVSVYSNNVRLIKLTHGLNMQSEELEAECETVCNSKNLEL